MLNYKRSATATLAAVFAFVGIFTVMLFTVPVIFRWYIGATVAEPLQTEYFLVLLIAYYICCIPAAAALLTLLKLLFNIRSGLLFETANVRLLNILSWCCFAVVPICFAAGFRFFTLFGIAAAAVLIGFIVRVVMHAFEYAVELKSENELTV